MARRGSGGTTSPWTTGALLLAVALATALRAQPASAQTIRGLLLERGTDRPIELGEVVMLDESGDTVAMALSDRSGLYSVTAPEPGSYRVIGRALGYLGRGDGPFELGEGGLVIVPLALDFAPIPIEGVDVETTRIVITDDALVANGFYERMMQGRGQFLTPEDVEANDARYTPGLFFGLDYVQPEWGLAPWQRWVGLWNPWGRGTCRARVFVDGVWINKRGYEQFNEGMGLEDVVPRDDIKAAELYWGLQAPLRYSAPDGFEGLETCGVVLLWTKAGR